MKKKIIIFPIEIYVNKYFPFQNEQQRVQTKYITIKIKNDQ